MEDVFKVFIAIAAFAICVFTVMIGSLVFAVKNMIKSISLREQEMNEDYVHVDGKSKDN